MNQTLEAPSAALVDFVFNGIVLGQCCKVYGDAPSSLASVPVRWWAADEPLRSVEWEGKIYVVGMGKHKGENGVQITVKPENITWWIPYKEFENVRVSLKAVQVA